MGIAQYDPTALGRPAWNAGRKVGVKKPLKQRQIWVIRFFLDREGRMKDRALFDHAIDSKLRGYVLLRSKSENLVTGTEIRTRATVVQQKTGRPVQFEITADVRASLLSSLERRGGTVDDYAFPSRVDHTDHLSTRQYARLVDEWVAAIGLRREDYGTHSLRRMKAVMIYKATGNLRAIQILLGHTKIENTVRYLGVDIEDALELAEHVEVDRNAALRQAGPHLLGKCSNLNHSSEGLCASISALLGGDATSWKWLSVHARQPHGTRSQPSDRSSGHSSVGAAHRSVSLSRRW